MPQMSILIFLKGRVMLNLPFFQGMMQANAVNFHVVRCSLHVILTNSSKLCACMEYCIHSCPSLKYFYLHENRFLSHSHTILLKNNVDIKSIVFQQH